MLPLKYFLAIIPSLLNEVVFGSLRPLNASRHSPHLHIVFDFCQASHFLVKEVRVNTYASSPGSWGETLNLFLTSMAKPFHFRSLNVFSYIYYVGSPMHTAAELFIPI
jgi:hypothetical protein